MKINYKKITKLSLVLMLFMTFTSLNAQDKYGSDPEKCKMNLSLFHESVKAKNYEEAMEPWKWVFENCPKASKHTYTDGLKIVKYLLKKEDPKAFDLGNNIYSKRVEYFPSNLGKVYSDWAKFLMKNGGSDTLINEKLNLAFKADPAGMSVKNIFKFFQNVVDTYKDSDTQKVFDTYDEVVEAVDLKIKGLSGEYNLLQKKIENGETLDKREQWRVDNEFFEKNLSGLGKIQGGLDGMVESIATCDRLIPLYKKIYDQNKADVVWLKRTASRLNSKDCKSDPFYVSLIEDWAKVDPSVDVLKYLASVYESQGRVADAQALATRIFEMGTPLDKARFLYSQANDLFKANKYGQARKKAREVLVQVPSYGKAYMLIGKMYRKSANSCGSNEFEKRMVYVAAARKMNQAMKADPSLGSRARQYLKNYRANFPSKTVLLNTGKNSGDSHRIGCWIGETVRIP